MPPGYTNKHMGPGGRLAVMIEGHNPIDAVGKKRRAIVRAVEGGWAMTGSGGRPPERICW